MEVASIGISACLRASGCFFQQLELVFLKQLEDRTQTKLVQQYPLADVWCAIFDGSKTSTLSVVRSFSGTVFKLLLKLKAELMQSYLKDYDAGDLSVFASQAAYANNETLSVGKPIPAGLGMDDENPLLIVVPSKSRGEHRNAVSCISRFHF
jgi:hypothetical protein